MNDFFQQSSACAKDKHWIGNSPEPKADTVIRLREQKKLRIAVYVSSVVEYDHFRFEVLTEIICKPYNENTVQ